MFYVEVDKSVIHVFELTTKYTWLPDMLGWQLSNSRFFIEQIGNSLVANPNTKNNIIMFLFHFRVWGVNCGNSPSPYLSWRDMYIERPRLQFNGCYISKTTYFRHGENSFQDQYYRPWHLVEYYRYLR